MWECGGVRVWECGKIEIGVVIGIGIERMFEKTGLGVMECLLPETGRRERVKEPCTRFCQLLPSPCWLSSASKRGVLRYGSGTASSGGGAIDLFPTYGSIKAALAMDHTNQATITLNPLYDKPLGEETSNSNMAFSIALGRGGTRPSLMESAVYRHWRGDFLVPLLESRG